MIARRFVLLFLVTATVAAPNSPAQHTWRTLDGAQPAGRRAHAVSWDTARRRLVVFGGDGPVQLADTWEWDGTAWARRDPATVPPPRYYSAMAYDEVRGRTVMFGGLWFQTLRSGTWEWDGSDWTEVTTANSPSPRYAHSLTWDPVRRRVLLFGGTERFGSSSQVDDMWEFDGVDWTRLQPASAPPARAGHGAAFDSARNRLVLYAGYGVGGTYDDVWEWDGTSWADVTPATMPPRRAAPLAFDPVRRRTVMYGGSASLASVLTDTWEWDGSTWQEVRTAGTAGPRADHGLVFAPSHGAVLAVGGYGAQLYLRDASIASYDGAAWRLRTAAPVFRLDTGIAWHPSTAQAVAFGGRIGLFAVSNRTHVFDGTGWRFASTPVAPPPRHDHLLVTDRGRDRLLMFGGTPGSGAVSDTWEWDGTAWSERTPAQSPPVRVDPAGCYDERRERVVLYGGAPPGFATPFADTWEWDGRDWRLVTTATSPGTRTRAAMAYDPARGVAVMFGGGRSALGVAATDETWEFDGIDWRLAQPAHRPSPRLDHTMVWDPVRERVVLFGTGDSVGSDETWEYDGVDWVEVTSPARPAFAKLVFDEAVGRTLGFADGAEGWALTSDTRPSVESYGVGCGGPAGALLLEAAPRTYPVIGRTVPVIASRVRPSWPVFVSLGISRTFAHGVSLPYDLGPAGMPGCSLYQSGEDAFYALAGGGGSATLGIAIAPDLALLGLEVFLQAFAPDATANALGWSASAGLALRIGR